MNYKRIYEQLIEKRRIKTFEGYGEDHHIIPKCLGGDNDKNNIVRFTAREHFIAHALLCKIYPKENKLWFAFNCMCNKWGHTDRRNERYYKISSRIYDWCKGQYSKIQSQKMKGTIPWNKGKKGLQVMSESSRKNLSKANSGAGNPMYGKKQTQKCKNAVALSHKIHPRTPGWQLKAYGEDHPRYGKHWGPEFGQKQTLAKCYTQLQRYNSNLIDETLWDNYKIMERNKNISMKTILKRFKSFKNMLELVNEKYKTNYILV